MTTCLPHLLLLRACLDQIGAIHVHDVCDVFMSGFGPCSGVYTAAAVGPMVGLEMYSLHTTHKIVYTGPAHGLLCSTHEHLTTLRCRPLQADLHVF